MNLREFVDRLTDSVNYTLDDGLIFWQERVLNRILFVAAVLGFPVLIPSLILSMVEKLYTVVVLDAAIYGTVVLLIILKKVSYRIRAVIFIVFSFVLGAVLLYVLQAAGGGTVWLFFGPIIAAILLGLRAGIAGLVLNGVITVLAGIYLYRGITDAGEAAVFLSQWIVVSLNFILLNILSTISIPSIFKGLQTSIKAQKTSSMKYARIFDNMMDVYFEISLSGTILEMTPSGEIFFECGYYDLIGNSIKSLMSYEHPNFMAALDKEGTLDNFETCFVSFQGTKRICSVNARINDDEPGRDSTIIGVIRDITQLKSIHAEKQKLEEKLIQSEKMESIGLLAGGVAHDLNNILSAIVAYPDMMLPEIPKDNPHHEYLEAMKTSGEKAAAILDDLLNLARRGIIIREIVDFNRIISDFIGSPECLKLQERHPEVEIEDALNASPSFITGSPYHLHKIVLNLVSNALEAIEGAGKILVSTETRAGFESSVSSSPIPLDDYLVLRVQDSGEGIRSEDLTRIFEPFFTRKIMGRSGTGLGMAVVWGTVKDHKGFITIESEVGEGTVIEIFIPLSAEKKSEESDDWKTEDYTGRGEKILVVDDLEEQREINALLLENLNYKVITAESGEAALKTISREGADLILMDMVMDPGINGIETYQEIIKTSPEQKVILLSGFAEDLTVEEALRIGIKDFLKKPCTLKKLSRSIRMVLDAEA